LRGIGKIEPQGESETSELYPGVMAGELRSR
jgi:hypothetical protein